MKKLQQRKYPIDSASSYPAFVWLMHNHFWIVSDSGGVQAAFIGQLVLVTRNVTERAERRHQGFSI
jgi:UDP-N-acetylglucosamine 2-epimerase